LRVGTAHLKFLHRDCPSQGTLSYQIKSRLTPEAMVFATVGMSKK
jgi:hypothetical protein